MIEKVFLNYNDPKIRDQLHFLGYKLCECTLHPSSKWLSFEVRDDMIIAHGAGLHVKDTRIVMLQEYLIAYYAQYTLN